MGMDKSSRFCTFEKLCVCFFLASETSLDNSGGSNLVQVCFLKMFNHSIASLW